MKGTEAIELFKCDNADGSRHIELFRRDNLKLLLQFFLCCLLFIGLLLLNLRELSKLGEENAYRNCQTSYLLATRELDGYLLMANGAVESAARRIGEMRAGGASHGEILAYMVRETANLDERIAGPTTGVYGLIGGVYLDGTGWVPPDDYDAMHRPWYLGAVAAGGELAHVPPFENLQTHSTTITICQMLSDGESVVAMDIPTTHLQRAVERLMQTDGPDAFASPCTLSEIFVMDPSGVIIAHSDASRLSQNYARSDDPAVREIARRIIEEGSDYFEIENGGERLIYCGGRLESNWYVFAAMEYGEVTRQTVRNLCISVAVAAAGIITMVAVLIHTFNLRQRTAEAESRAELMRVRQETAEAKAAYRKVRKASTRHSSIAHALSANYSHLYYVNTQTGHFTDYFTQEETGEPVERSGEDFFGANMELLRNGVHPDDWEDFRRRNAPERMLAALEKRGEQTTSYRILKDGAYVYATTRAIRLRGDTRHIMVSTGLDESIESRNELTGLYTEHALYVRGREVLHEHPDGWCVIALDVEHFKLFNEWYGREAGDRLLAQIGARLLRVEQDTGGLACYLGQDDFALIAPYDEPSVRRLYKSVHQFVMEHGMSIGFMPAIGVCPADGETSVQELFDRAAQAAQNAKTDYHRRIRVFEDSMYRKTEQDYQLLSDFQQALKNRELFIVLQPQCEIEQGRVVGAESLVRWRREDGTMVSPGKFVPVLEQYGFVTDLDQFVWEEVCRWQRAWIDGGHTPLPVSVNVSQIDIFTIDVPAHFEQLLAKYSLPVDVVKIEITESAYVGDGTVSDTVKRLREKGFLVLMDDFGSGYSSLNMLRSLSVDIIKLDAQFLRMEGDDRKGVQILESIVSMAKSMEAPIIVEGVETQEEKDFVRRLGCRYVQGYYFYKPMPVPDFEKLIGDETHIDVSGFGL